jgi:hypothetical protein
LEATRLTPHIEKNLAQEVLGKRLIADEPKKPAVDVEAPRTIAGFGDSALAERTSAGLVLS